MGRDASMEIGGSLKVIADGDSERYKDVLNRNIIDSKKPFVSVGANKNIDGITSATEKYYVDRGLTEVSFNGKSQDGPSAPLKQPPPQMVTPASAKARRMCGL